MRPAIGLISPPGFTKLWPMVATLSAMDASFGLLDAGATNPAVGTASAVWTGIGAAGTPKRRGMAP